MGTEKRFLFLAIALVFLLTLLPAKAAAVSVGASPAQVSFGEVLKGGYAETDVTVSTNSDEILLGHMEIEGQIKSWITLSGNTTSFNTSLARPATISIIVQPPQDTPTGTYSGRLTIVGDTVASVPNRAGSVVKSSVMLPLTVTVTGTQRISCTAGAFGLQDIEEGLPIVAWATTRNTGNVRLSPLMTFTVWDSLQDKIVLKAETRSNELLPTRTERSLVTVEHGLPIGQYWAEVSMPECESEALITFSVMEKGGIADNGELTELNVPAKTAVGETVPVTALFYNKGSRVVTAQFKGTVKKGGKIVATITSDEVAIESGKAEKLQAFFVPEEPGAYTVTGRIIYNRKLTFEKNANFQAEGESRKQNAFITPLAIYAALAATAIFFIQKISKRNRRRR